jgi:electron transfer flavoprotein alpha subunit
MSETGGICTFCEREDVALELLSAARSLGAGGAVVSLVIGGEGDAVAREHLAHGADVSYVIEAGDVVADAELQLETLRHVLRRRDPDVLLIGGTTHGTELAARLAQRLGVSCATDCTWLGMDGGKLLVERTCLGRFVARQLVGTRPAIATVQPRRFETLAKRQEVDGRPEHLIVGSSGARLPILETRQRERSSVRIDKADVVVGVGRGLKSEKDLQMIEELAKTLGGVVGASRPLTDDLQWLSADRKIGLSGMTVKPRLYIACGISGQIEHNVGMREAGTVVAINCDASAPIMRQADYCVHGDLHQVVPALIEAIGQVGARALIER